MFENEMLSPKAQRAWSTLSEVVLDPSSRPSTPQGQLDAVMLFNSIVPQIQRLLVASRRKINVADLKRLATLDAKECYSAGELQSVGMPCEDIVSHLLRPTLPTEVLRAVEAQSVFDSPSRKHVTPPHHGFHNQQQQEQRSLSPTVQMLSSTLAAGTTRRTLQCTNAYARAVEEYKLQRSTDGPGPFLSNRSGTPPSATRVSQPRSTTPRTLGGGGGGTPRSIGKSSATRTSVTPQRGSAGRHHHTPSKSPSRECACCNPHDISTHTRTFFLDETPTPKVFMAGVASRGLSATPARDDVNDILQKLHVKSPPPITQRSADGGIFIDPLLAASKVSESTLSPRRVRRWLDAFNVNLRSASLTVDQFMGLPSAQQQQYFLGWRIPHVKALVITQAMVRHLSTADRVGGML